MANAKNPNLNSTMELSKSSFVDIEVQPEVVETPALNVILKLQDKERKGEFNFHCEDLVTDPATGELRKARLLNNVGTIWQDEQKNIDAKWAEKNIRTLRFNNGNAIISIGDKTAIRFAEVCGSNLSNPHKSSNKKIYFDVWNPIKEAAEAESQEMLMLEAMQLAATEPFERMKKHAVYLGISLANVMGQAKREKELRVDYLKYAKKDPKKFKDSIVNPAVDVAWAIRLAITNGTIDLEKQSGQAYWASGGFIADIPLGEDGVTALIKLAISNTDIGNSFSAQLKEISK